MPKLKKLLFKTALSSIVIMLVAGLVLFTNGPNARAASTYTVTSTGDASDATPGDNICATAGSICTLRAAIEEANAHAGADIIHFNVTGAADFSTDGYRFTPASAYPAITETLTVDGSTQPGYVVNSATNSAAFNNHIVIEIDYSNTSGESFLFEDASSNVIRGIAFGGGELGVVFMRSPNSIVEGCYFGFHSDGTSFAIGDTALSVTGGSSNSRVGGTNAAQRNAFGNASAGLEVGDFDQTGSAPSHNAVVQGNFFGVAPNGTTAAGNLAIGLRVLGSNGAQIGGTSPGARNIIGNNGGGIGIASSANSAFSLDSHTANDTIVEGNYIGLLADGVTPAPNASDGISVTSDNPDLVPTGNRIGGSTAAARNVISSNGFVNIQLRGVVETVITGNYIGTDASGAVNDDITSSVFNVFATYTSDSIIGGTTTGTGNTIVGGAYAGVLIGSIADPEEPLVRRNSVLGNSIYGNGVLGGIELNGSSGNSFNPDSNVGPTPNDTGDIDTGSNGYINTPEISSATYDGTKATIAYDLDALDSPTDSYRVEFFVNETVGDSGFGEGKTYLGSATVSPGQNQIAVLTAPDGFDFDGKLVSATTTAIDGGTASGFGATSEFSANATFSYLANPVEYPDILPEVGGVPGLVAIMLAIALATVSYVHNRRIRSSR